MFCDWHRFTHNYKYANVYRLIKYMPAIIISFITNVKYANQLTCIKHKKSHRTELNRKHIHSKYRPYTTALVRITLSLCIFYLRYNITTRIITVTNASALKCYGNGFGTFPLATQIGQARARSLFWVTQLVSFRVWGAVSQKRRGRCSNFTFQILCSFFLIVFS